MRWVIDGREYDTDTAEVIAHSGRDRYTGLRDYELYRSPEGDYFTVRDDNDGEGTYLVRLNVLEAYDIYLSLPYHVVDEDESFDFAKDEEEDEEEAPVS